jgi:hypothetical protein
MSPTKRYTVELVDKSVWKVRIDAPTAQDALMAAQVHWIARYPRATKFLNIITRTIMHTAVTDVCDITINESNDRA